MDLIKIAFLAALLLLTILPQVNRAQLYADPPIGKVIKDNIGTADSLDNDFNPNFSLRINDNKTGFVTAASLEIAGLSIEIDNLTYPATGLQVIMRRGIAPINLSGNGCVENTIADYELFANFSFRNVTIGGIKTHYNEIEIPQQIIDEMQYSSGADRMNISIGGNVFVNYIRSGCNQTTLNASVPLFASASYNVGGSKKLFFMRAPVLSNQIEGDNRFDMIVFSQSPLYLAQINLYSLNISQMNGTKSINKTQIDNESFNIGQFEIVRNVDGLETIEEAKINQSRIVEHDDLTTPIPLEYGNDSFAYTYEVNYSYYATDQRYIVLNVTDIFLQRDNYEAALNGPYIGQTTLKVQNYTNTTLPAYFAAMGGLALVIIIGVILKLTYSND